MPHAPRFVLAGLTGAAACTAALSLPAGGTAPDRNPAYTDPAQTDEDFPFQGEYAGTVAHDAGPVAMGVQVVALGGGKFAAVGYPGGLPGAGWTRPDRVLGTGERLGERVRLECFDWAGTRRVAEVAEGRLVVLGDDGTAVATLPKVDRAGPTLGQKPPPGAIVIFDGTGVDRLVDGRMTDDGLLMEGATSRDTYGDATLHLEFLLPYQPLDRGQGRANSGCYVHGCYEVQILDSFGLEGRDNECGGIYKAAAPDVNMCLPPLAWQTYDIDFTAARFEDGRKVRNARMTVRHNGVVIHPDREIPAMTPGGPQQQEGPTGPLFLQDHGNPVRFRNVWVLPKP
jgi:hypothetical protein